jgi:hypothetical protein
VDTSETETLLNLCKCFDDSMLITSHRDGNIYSCAQKFCSWVLIFNRIDLEEV